MKLTPDIVLIKCFGTYDFRSKGQRSRSEWSFKIFVVSALWLHVYLTDLPYTWYKYSPRRDNVLRSISRSKGQRSSSHLSFEMVVTLVIRSFCRVCSMAPSLFVWFPSYVAYIQHIRVQCVAHLFRDERSRHMGRLKFLPCPLCSSIPISPIHFILYLIMSVEVVTLDFHSSSLILAATG